MTDGRLRRTDTRKDLDALETIYKRFETEGVYEIPKSPAEPPLVPPSGYEEDPWYIGKEIAVRITRFVALCAPSFQATPDQIFFATELAALNVFNAQDAPIPEVRREAARQAAYDYYTQSLAKIPDKR
jgi:hypothetical protein